MKKIFYLLATITLLGVGCTRVPATPTPITTQEPPKYQTYSNSGVSITPLEVVQDSRCPAGARCVWAGTVELKARLDAAGESKEEILKLGTPVAFGDKQIELTDVAPGKEINKTILPNEYSFTFSVTQPTVDATGAHCGGFIKNAPTCPSGFHCKLHLIADTGGECVKDSAVPSVEASGIEGTVTIGPTCPVQRMPPDPACADKPYQATLQVQTADGQKTITQFTTGADGTFKVDVAPGNYVVVPVSTSRLPRGSSQPVTVEKNKFTTVSVTFDSGIR